MAVLVAAWGQPSFAQSGTVPGTTAPASSALDRALIKLAANQRDVAALLDAGSAALALDDTDAAQGFYSRAAELAPTDPRARAGLGAAMVRSENPYDALLMFEEAEKLGAPADLMAGDRGLAWDLVGNTAVAQTFYRQVLARSFDAETTRRLAISLAISGDAAEARRVLKPLLDRRDPAAMRAQAFVLAISGDADGAAEIAQATMARDNAVRITPYLRYMPRLTAAQQAGAANFGHFPRIADIGRDDPRVAQYKRDAAGKRTADAQLIPSGEPLGRKQGKKEQREKERRAAAEAKAAASSSRATAKAQPSVAAVPAAPPMPRPSVAIAAPKPALVPAASPAAPASGQGALAKVAASQASAELPAVRTVAVPPDALPERPPVAAAPPASAGSSQIASFDLVGTEGSRVAAPAQPPTPPPAPPPTPPVVREVTAPAPVPPPPAPQPAPPRSVADAFADFAIAPTTAAAPQDGAVDITRIKPRIEEPPKPKAEPPKGKAEAEVAAKGGKAAKAEKPAKPAKPVQPSRNWVQIGTGRDKAALAFDWRRMTKAQPDLFKGKQGYTAAWGQTNRMVTGPFDSAKTAQQFVATLKGKGIDSFTFTSAEGEEVTQLPAGK